MGKTIRGEKGPGYEYWGKRPFSGVPPSKINKKITHKLERAVKKRLIQKETKRIKKND